MKPIAQGDVYIYSIEAIPSEAKENAQIENRIVVTHSETGHDHVIEVDVIRKKPNVSMYSGDNPLVSWLEVNRPCTLKHMRSFDTHAPVTLPPGKYEVRRQREYTPEGWRRVED